MKQKHILVILPHPDDEVFPMSGTLSKYIHEGAYVTYVCLTLGEMGRNLGNPAFANRVSLPLVRKQELENSCKIIGIQNLRLWGYHDKTVEFEAFEPLDQRLLDVIEEVKPDLVYTFYPGHGVHPDHNACGAAVIRTIQSMPTEKRPIVHCCAFPDAALGKADISNDITPYLDQKIGALNAHGSQFQAYLDLTIGKHMDPEFMKRIKTEQFWIYPFKD